MQTYCLRIDKLSSQDEERLIAWLQKQGTAIGCEEDPHECNPHYHVWLKSKKSIEALRANFKLRFPEHKGNGSYSIKTDEGNLKYICKGPRAPTEKLYPKIIVNTMEISDDDIRQAYEDYWTDNKAFTERKKQKNKKEVKSNFESALEYCKNNGVTDCSHGWKIVTVLIDYYRTRVKCEPNDFQLKLMAKSIQTHLVYDRAKAEDKMFVYANLLDARARNIVGSDWIMPSF